jgi:predicted O-linked N-acetylglucosamine transferase (SPINDLY family)
MVSHCFRRHSVWQIVVEGLLTHLDRSRFEVFIYHLGASDDETARARALCDRWRDSRSVGHPSRWAGVIAEDRPDILFYPEIGLDPKAYLLARERLAPVQAAGWGHPITSGLASIDLFLSGDLIEPEDASSHYREKLVRLPGTGACTAAFEGLREDLPAALAEELAACSGPRILVPQTPFKLDPHFDALLARIAQVLGRCTVLIPREPTHAKAYEMLAARVGEALRARGCDAQAVLKFVPWLPQGQFLALLDEADVVLDCTAFSGYTTARIAVHAGAPMVTLEGPFMRQRLAAGVHRRIGITDTVVHDEDAYVAVAVALAREGRQSRAGQARRHALQAAAPLLDGDLRVVRAFEQAVLQALEASTAVPQA